ncbi:hypothetical protein [Nocardia wallacei]|uniref:hypothetical protein n=1 Tax=Nocardia wallacei TaxID=480035 RepID=UPI0016573D9E|nr:hypothetical protein [Nocardia wallacei]
MRFNDHRYITVDTLAGPGAPDGVVIRSDLLPPSTHGSNIRGIVDRAIWDALRIPVCTAADNRCEICGEQAVRNGRPARPDCHEKWVFDTGSDRPVQRLKRLIALCPGCHQVQHSGLARVKRAEHEVVARLCRLNNWTQDQAADDLDRSSARCRYLDRFEWDLDLSVLRGQLVVRRYQNLYIPAADRARLGNSFFGLPPRGAAGHF